MIVLSDDFERRWGLRPTRLVAGGVLRHSGRTSATERNDQEVIHVFHDLGQLPVETFEHLSVEPAAKDAVLEPSAVGFQRLGDAPQAFRVPNIVS